LSFNSLGSEKKPGKVTECAIQITKTIAKPHPELLHFDLSHN